MLGALLLVYLLILPSPGFATHEAVKQLKVTTKRGYKIQPSGLLSNFPYRKFELQRLLRVSPDVLPPSPLVGVIRPLGETLCTLWVQLVEKSRVYIPERPIDDSPVGFKVNKFYLTGKVIDPNRYLRSSNTRVQEAQCLTAGIPTSIYVALIKTYSKGRDIPLCFRCKEIEAENSFDNSSELTSGLVVVS